MNIEELKTQHIFSLKCYYYLHNLKLLRLTIPRNAM